MKIKATIALLTLTHLFSHAQGLFVVDQQSTNLIEGSASLGPQPMGQSFTPTLSLLSYVALNFFDGVPGGGPGATIYVNLRSNSISGPILGVSSVVALPSGFFGVTNFLFLTPISLAQGTVYFLQPLGQSGGGIAAYVTDGNYTRGTLIQNGVPVSGRNLWFQEGVIMVPEPSTTVLLSLGGLVWIYVQRKRQLRYHS